MRTNCIAAIGFTIVMVISTWPRISWSQIEPESYAKSFTIYWENDSFTGTDKDYSNGIKLTWSKAYVPSIEKSSGIKGWMFDHLPLMNKPSAQRSTSFSMGQSIFTPEDTDRTDLIENDRPYAGYSYLEFGYISTRGLRRDVWVLEIGILGPASQAEGTQSLVHDILDVDRANGWDNQLDDELGINLTFVSNWRLWHFGNSRGLGIDVIPHLGGRLGNIAIHANTGAEIRIGWSVPKDFGTCPIRSGCSASSNADNGAGLFDDGRSNFAIYLFVAGDGRAVIRNIFLDGNTFQDSHSVDKETLVMDLMGGIAVHYGRFRMTYSMVKRTREFKERDDDHTFGAISLSYYY